MKQLLFILLGLAIMAIVSLYSHHKPHSTTKISVVVFDFGGVIGSADRDFVRNEVARAFHITPDDAARILSEQKQHYINGGEEKIFWEMTAQSLGTDLPKDWVNEFHAILATAIKEVPGVLDIVKSLHKQRFKVALLTNVRKDKAQVLTKLGYYSYFHPVVLSCDVGLTKPNPKIYEVLLQKLKTPAEQCLLIDNKIENVEAAQKAGFDGIHFSSKEQLIVELQKRGISV